MNLLGNRRIKRDVFLLQFCDERSQSDAWLGFENVLADDFEIFSMKGCFQNPAAQHNGAAVAGSIKTSAEFSDVGVDFVLDFFWQAGKSDGDSGCSVVGVRWSVVSIRWPAKVLSHL